MLQAKTAEGTSGIYLRMLRCYLEKFGDTFHCQMPSLTPREIADYLRGLEVSPRAKNNVRACIGAFFKFCKERGWLPRDHDGIDLVPKFKATPGTIAVFTPWEMAVFLSSARPEIVPFLALGGFAGLRSAEIGRLDWSEVRLADRFIEVKANAV